MGPCIADVQAERPKGRRSRLIRCAGINQWRIPLGRTTASIGLGLVALVAVLMAGYAMRGHGGRRESPVVRTQPDVANPLVLAAPVAIRVIRPDHKPPAAAAAHEAHPNTAIVDQPPRDWRVPELACRVILHDATPAAGTSAVPLRTFFLDLRKLGAALGGRIDTRSMQLVTADGGTRVPFSLDYRYGDRQPAPGETIPKPTGYLGERFSLGQGRLRRLGYVSFRGAAGPAQYHLYFRVTADGHDAEDRPAPALRPWWIEGVADPDFRQISPPSGKPGLYAVRALKSTGAMQWAVVPRPESAGRTCLRLTCPEGGQLSSRPGAVTLDRRTAGRRVIYYQQLYAEQGLAGRDMALPLTNAYSHVPGAWAVVYYFRDIPPRQWWELSAEGRVGENYDGTAQSFFNEYAGSCHVGEIHVQYPPDLSTDQTIGVETDLAQPGDEILLSWKAPLRDYLYGIRTTLQTKTGRTIPAAAERVENWLEGFALEAAVVDRDGKIAATLADAVAPGRAWERPITLRGVRPGLYRLRLEVRSRRTPPEVVARLENELKVINGPFTTP
jgi:hypothetical protein